MNKNINKIKRFFLFNVGPFYLYEAIFIFISIATLITLAIIFKSGVLEIISVLLGICAISLNCKRKKYAFFFYAVYVVLYGISSFLAKQYGEGILNTCINLPIYLYTLYKFYLKGRFKKNNEEKVANNNDFYIAPIKKWMVITIIIFIPVVTVGYGFLLQYFDSKYPFLNALATAVAIVAAFLASKTIFWQWLFWILYSVVLTSIWSLNFINDPESSGLLYLALNIIYIVINIYSFVLWGILKKKQDKLIESKSE